MSLTFTQSRSLNWVNRCVTSTIMGSTIRAIRQCKRPRKKWWAGVRRHLKLVQSPSYKEYNHFFIYPNLAIGLTNGSLMSVQTYEPTAVDACTLNFRLRMANSSAAEGSKRKAAVRDAVVANFTDFNHRTLEEDREVAESCQGNLEYLDRPAVIGTCEDRIRYFHEAWRRDMGRG